MSKGRQIKIIKLAITQIESWMMIQRMASARCFLISTKMVAAKNTKAIPSTQKTVEFSIPNKFIKATEKGLTQAPIKEKRSNWPIRRDLMYS